MKIGEQPPPSPPPLCLHSHNALYYLVVVTPGLLPPLVFLPLRVRAVPAGHSHMSPTQEHQLLCLESRQVWSAGNKVEKVLELEG